ncbi:MAG TPA: patatin family protein [Bacteroidales bacterium]|nr:patatin family protein [Bacteroidales bacterium]
MKQALDNITQEHVGAKTNDTCLVLEGGGLRGAFTSGVLESFLEYHIDFPRVVGVSAGACTGASFISRQNGRNWKVNVEAPSDKRFMGIKHLLMNGSYFNMEFIFEEIPQRLIPFDEKAFYQNPSEFDVIATSFSTGKSVVISKNEISQFGLNRVLRASSSIPLMSKPVEINGHHFYDGGVSDSIPVKYALEKHKKVVVVLTRPRGYRKEIPKSSFLYKLAFRKNAAFLKAIINRNEEYNKTLDFCNEMEKEGRLYIIAPQPELIINRTEHNFQKRANLYNHGYSLTNGEIENLVQFFKA